jgi:hypothetical protein
MGLLLDHNIVALVIMGAGAQAAGAALFWRLRAQLQKFA